MHFVVGSAPIINEIYRNLPYVGVLKPEFVQKISLPYSESREWNAFEIQQRTKVGQLPCVLLR